MKKITVFWTIIVTVIVISTLAILYLIYGLYLVLSGSDSAHEALSPVTIYLFALRLTGTLAFIFIGIAASLGALRNVILSFYKNVTFWKLHTKWASSLGIGFALSHLTIYLLYQYRLEIPLSLKLFTPNFERITATSTLIFFSTLALGIFIMNLTISNIPALKEKKWWKPLHILNFLGFFLVLFHAFYIGTNSSDIVYQLLYGVFFVLALSGLLHRSFKFASKEETKNTLTSEEKLKNQNVSTTKIVTDIPPMKIQEVSANPPSVPVKQVDDSQVIPPKQ